MIMKIRRHAWTVIEPLKNKPEKKYSVFVSFDQQVSCV